MPAEIAEQVIAVLGEALSNVARHARATSVDISLMVGEGTLNLVVSDNGVGMPGAERRAAGQSLIGCAGVADDLDVGFRVK